MVSTSKRIKRKKKKKNNIFRDWIMPVVAAVVLASLINKFLFFNVYVPSGSMIPTINKWDRLLITKVYNYENIKRGDIIVFYSDEFNEMLIKRIIGLPGDHIEINNGLVNVNGKELVENYVKNNDEYSGIFDVPKDKFFFLGDNRSNSDDSRRWLNPYIDKSDIKGKAVLRFYPFKNFGSL
jgi:signal peptidase I